MSTIQRFHVVTGGPGSGKSTLIDALGKAGHAGTVEAGRAIIQDQTLIGGPALPWKDPAAFAEMMLSWEMRSYRLAETSSGPVFFDRGIPDVIGYLRLVGLPVPAHLLRAAEHFRYNGLVFVAPPWPAIFVNDEERRQSLPEAERTCRSVTAAYADCGYRLVDLPLAPVAARLRFVLEAVGNA
ncbi:MAG: AAA family ATPase [Pseudomonadota bacterium]